MRVLTAAQMREADRVTIERGTPGEVLMQRAAKGIVQVLERDFSPLSAQRVVVICGKGNNGGDGLVAAKLLEGRVAALQIVRADGDSAPALDKQATVVIDALLGTGFRGEVEGHYAELIQAMNTEFPRAKVIAVDIPSAMQVRADVTVTFAAPKAEMLMSPNAHFAGRIVTVDIGIPEDLLQSGIALSQPRDFAKLFQPRKRDGHKGDYGHVLVIGGAPGKTGAAAMAGLAALKMGAGLVTVACSDPSRLAPELMTQSLEALDLSRATVLAIGPGLGMQHDLVQRVMTETKVPVVIDADALNVLAGTDFRGRGRQTIMTPHPGEMARLLGRPVRDRMEDARSFARERNVALVLKGHRTLIALPDDKVWINPTGSPAMGKGGSGDILTGMVAGLSAQFPQDLATAVPAAVWLHGRAGEIGAQELTENCLLAAELLSFLPRAIRECVAA